MKKTQPVKNNIKNKVVGRKTVEIKPKANYGTSKLEEYFAKQFLDKLGLKYVYEYEVKKIGRFYDFAIVFHQEREYLMENKHNVICVKQYGQNITISFLIEIDGSYWHADPRIMEHKKLNNTQRHNKFVDYVKNKYCERNGIKLIRIFEYDIKNNPKIVIEELKKVLSEQEKKKKIIFSKLKS